MATKRKEAIPQKNGLAEAKRLIKECQETQNTYLDLGNCGITNLNDLPELFECLHLQTLILASGWWDFDTDYNNSRNSGHVNKLKTISPRIASLKNITTLIIDNNDDFGLQIRNTNFFFELKQLKYLHLAGCEISDFNFLNNLPEIRSLYLGSTSLSNIDFVKNLPTLEDLDLFNCGISKIEPLANHSSLKYLDIRGCKLSDSHFLKNLSGLQALYINTGKNYNFNFLYELTELRKLEISNSYIHDFGFLTKLNKLEFLTLIRGRVKNIRELGKSPSLKALSIIDSALSNIESIDELFSNLEFLNLSVNNLSDVDSLKNSTKLKSLILNNNNISDLKFIEKLIELETLLLNKNKIFDLTPLSSLKDLKTLNLSDNKIQNVPSFIFQLNLDLSFEQFTSSSLGLSGNSIVSPPMEILKQGRESILDWFKATKKKLNEIKIILIGDPKSGKTSLLRMLKDGTFDEKEVQTDGINIEHIQFGECPMFKRQKSLHHLTGHFWDFGGQEIMNATHQFFLTNRSIYLLVLDARKDANVTAQIRQWVKRIKATGGNSPIIIVANQSDVNTAFGFTNERELQQEFPQIKYFIKTSCKSKENIDLIKNKLEEIIPEAELFNTQIDERWISIKEKLQEETKSKHFLNETRFIEICENNKLRGEDARKNAINFLNDLGLVLHFEDLKLAEYFVLEPYWITYGVYQILTSSYAGQKKGKVELNKLGFIVNDEEDKKETYHPLNYRKISYSNNERRFLVEILNQFKLSFYLPDGTHFIIPDLLSTSEPINTTDDIRNDPDNIRFVYEYEYLPNSVMPNIMVDLHQVLKNMWRTGCVLENNGCRALITNYQNRISIVVAGDYKKKREFMAVIRHFIDSINVELSDKPKMLIPLPGSNSFADYDVLLTREKKGKVDFILDEDKPSEKQFEISKLLEGLPNKEDVKEISKKLDEILDKQTVVMIDVALIKDSQRDISSKLDTHYQYLLENINIKDNDIKNAIKELNAEQTEEITNEIIQWINTAFGEFDGEMDNKLKDLYSDIKKSDNLEMKLKLSIPFVNLLGLDAGIETKFDLKGWTKKMYTKYELKLFQLMGHL